ncbi:hypothetical protein [Aeromonas jandaei]|uniref:hypothetical protein n=1 Tax=Aeromonas jandaei TaxID=650 RepID=UPI001ADDA07F|nr:hypothetical protein [Aeromonas jandaei]QTL95331.1 hypothetical protein AjGTCBM29_03240 [Aeromonas jandaei]
MGRDKNGEWWNGGWQRRGKSEWKGEQTSSFRPNDQGSVVLNGTVKGNWLDEGSECKASINPLANGVFIWTEIKGTGHAFVSVHVDNSPFVFTYGRFGRMGSPAGMVGDGVLNNLKYEDARKYYREELYQKNAKVFLITDADYKIAKMYFDRVWDSGTPAKHTEPMGDRTKRNGHTIDQYDVTGVNCTTHSVEGIKVAGSKVFEGGYTTKDQMRINNEEDFAVPVSLQRFLELKSSDTSMVVVDITSEFKSQYPNTEGYAPDSELTPDMMLKRVMAESASLVGKSSPYSGGTVGGLLKGAYDVNK